MILQNLALAFVLALGQDHQHHHDVDQKGDKVMGFPHEKSTHHFKLHAYGGAIEVEANDASDAANRDKIRQHLGHIAHMFSAGDFSAPMLIHSQKVAGTDVMKQRNAEIAYRFEESAKGGRVRITTKDKKALAAVHEFLRFQISDHRTGDTGKIE